MKRIEGGVGQGMEGQNRTAGEPVGRLEAAMTQLAAAQVRTEQEVRELAAAQVRTEQRLDRLADAQVRTEEQVRELAAAQVRTEERIGELATVQRETSQAVAELTRGLDRLRKQVGGLSDTVGGDIEDIAYIVLYDVLKREFGWDVGVLERDWKTWNGEIDEVNVFGLATDPARPTHSIWIVGEAKHNLTVRDVQQFARLVERARRNLTGEIFPVCFCYRARPEVVTEMQKAGLRLVYSYGKLV